MLPHGWTLRHYAKRYKPFTNYNTEWPHQYEAPRALRFTELSSPTACQELDQSDHGSRCYQVHSFSSAKWKSSGDTATWPHRYFTLLNCTLVKTAPFLPHAFYHQDNFLQKALCKWTAPRPSPPYFKLESVSDEKSWKWPHVGQEFFPVRCSRILISTGWWLS